MATIPAGNDPFVGGSITRTGQANVAGAIASANTGVGNPIGGVNPGTIFSARNNRGSNIGIPYTRLVPLGSKQGGALGRPPTPAPAGGGPDVPDPNERVAVTETEDLRSMTVAFILGKRSAPGLTVAYVEPNGTESFEQNVDFGFSYNTNGLMAPGMPGTERFQKLCSFEYLSRYFTNALWSKGIVLQNNGAGANAANAGGTFAAALGAAPLPPQWATGLPRMVAAAAKKRSADRGVVAGAAGADLEGALGASTLTVMTDVGKGMGLPGSEAEGANRIQQGIFAHDMGPFLRGKGITHDVLKGTLSGVTQDIDPAGAGPIRPVAPYHVSRCAGDELAFALFERLLEDKGFSDWRPDGIVLSKGADDPSDKLSDEMLKSRDGELFNMRIQGPAVTSSWCGDPSMEVMPLDKTFVIIVADVWWGDITGAEADVQAFVNGLLPASGAAGVVPGANATAQRDSLRKYLAAREKELMGNADGKALTATPKPKVPGTSTPFAARPDNTAAGEYATSSAGPRPADLGAGAPAAAVAARTALQDKWDSTLRALQAQWAKSERMAQFQTAQATSYRNGEITRFCNFRVKLATSSQMINYSAPRFDAAGVQVTTEVSNDEYRRVHNQSRMGLRLGMNGGEYIVGGWCIGNVLDTAASRAAFPSAGTNIGVRTAPNSMAINLNVKVEWWDSDRMWRSFMNVDNSLTPRYVKTKPLAGVDGDGAPDGTVLYTAPNMPPMVALALRERMDADGTAAKVHDASAGKSAGDYAALNAAGKAAVLAQLVPSLALA